MTDPHAEIEGQGHPMMTNQWVCPNMGYIAHWQFNGETWGHWWKKTWDLDGFGVLNVQRNLMYSIPYVIFSSLHQHAKHRAALRGFALSRLMLSSGTSRTSQVSRWKCQNGPKTWAWNTAHGGTWCMDHYKTFKNILKKLSKAEAPRPPMPWSLLHWASRHRSARRADSHLGPTVPAQRPSPGKRNRKPSRPSPSKRRKNCSNPTLIFLL